MAADPTLEPYLRSVAERVDAQLRRVVAGRRPAGPPRLAEALAYALSGGGKRLRPALVLATCEALGGDAGDDGLAMRYAVALEMIHTYSLVHDDLPCMDDDDLRRGRPTVHRAFDEATAVLVGDALQSLAFAHLLAHPEPRAGALARLLAKGAARMVDGQAMDMAAEGAAVEGRALTEAEVLELMAAKTGALIAAAVTGGAIAATGSADGLDATGRQLGLAFQIADDLLDLTGDAVAMGKAVRKDAGAGKATLPSLIGIDEARRRADAACGEAIRTLDAYGDRGATLRALARFVVTRKR